MNIPTNIKQTTQIKHPTLKEKKINDPFYWRQDQGNYHSYIHITDLEDSHLVAVEKKIKTFPRNSTTLGHGVTDWIIRINIEKRLRKQEEHKIWTCLDKAYFGGRRISFITQAKIETRKELKEL